METALEAADTRVGLSRSHNMKLVRREYGDGQATVRRRWMLPRI